MNLKIDSIHTSNYKTNLIVLNDKIIWLPDWVREYANILMSTYNGSDTLGAMVKTLLKNVYISL